MSLELLENKLKELKKQYSKKEINYSVPSIWNDPFTDNRDPQIVNPFDFFLNAIEKLENLDIDENNAYLSYNFLIRFTCAYEHDITTNNKKFPEESFRNEGTFLKALALIPYLKSIGVNQISHFTNYQDWKT